MFQKCNEICEKQEEVKKQPNIVLNLLPKNLQKLTRKDKLKRYKGQEEEGEKYK